MSERELRCAICTKTWDEHQTVIAHEFKHDPRTKEAPASNQQCKHDLGPFVLPDTCPHCHIEWLQTALRRIEDRSHTMSDADDEQALFDIGEIANRALSGEWSAVETTAELCPNCGKDEVGTFTADDSFLYGSSNPVRLIAKDVLFFRCMACHLEYTGEDGEEKRMEAIRAHLTTRSAVEPSGPLMMNDLPYYLISQDIIDKVVEVQRWFDERNVKRWSVAGIGPLYVEPSKLNISTGATTQCSDLDGCPHDDGCPGGCRHSPEKVSGDDIGSFCGKHSAARYVRKYGCPSCAMGSPSYTLPSEKAAALRCSHSSNSTEKRFSDDRSK